VLLVAEANPPPRRVAADSPTTPSFSLQCLRIYLEKSYREALDLLNEMPQILAEIGLEKADLLITRRW